MSMSNLILKKHLGINVIVYDLPTCKFQKVFSVGV